jgi:1-deoxy-D-xylulose-5-phosphate reductoisomerase
MKRIAILGSTGSIGVNTLAVVAAHSDRLRCVALAAHSNIDLLAEQFRAVAPQQIAVWDPEQARSLEKRLSVPVASGDGGLIELVRRSDVDMVVIATSRSSALTAMLEAIELGKPVALASKELLVMAGGYLMQRARQRAVPILPIDSEHAALFQCLQGTQRDEVERLIVTGSGGPLWRVPANALAGVSKEQVLAHPKWRMGQKITVDSATLMNKGLEIIEARWLFDFPLERLKVLIHPEAAIHALVELRDGSMLAQMSACDMRLPIQAALSYPERWNSAVERVRLTDLGGLHFYEPDLQRFPCLALAWQAARAGQQQCVAMNAANDVAVEAYLGGRISFLDIPNVIKEVLVQPVPQAGDGLEGILGWDRWARQKAKESVDQCSILLSNS